ncbi:YdeI/OmpD-associated family protein [Ktedonospora formicarum]|nr:YdeI/OmpD-associated family protein [Ktedonospora formicarum]
MKKAEQISTIAFADEQSWETWLAEHHADTPGLWLKLAKKQSGIPSITYAEALQVALCYGWIDGQKATVDEQYWLQKFTPRRPRSIWSKVNREHIEKLIASGRMQAAGLRQVELAQADGRWDAAYTSQSKSSIPPDLQVELERNPQAQAFFDSLNSRNRFAIIHRVETTKKPETRAAHIQKFIVMLNQGQKIYP